MTDPMDLPEEEPAYSLVFPFVVCQTQGGPYDDAAFVAGVQVGKLDQALTAAAAVGADRLSATVYTTLVHQLELVGMARGFPVVTYAEVTATEDHDAMPEWSFITFETSKETS